MNVSSWDEERLFVQPFIWQRNCKKRDLFNGSFSSQLRALVGCNGFSNDWDTLIHTDLNINCLVSSAYNTGTMSHHVLPLSFYFAPQNKLNLPKKLCGFSKSRTKRCKWKFIVFQLCFFFDPVMSRGCRPQHSWHQPRLKRRILKYHYDLQTWRSPSIFSLWVLVVCGCRRNYLSWGEREATLTLESLHSGLSQ